MVSAVLLPPFEVAAGSEESGEEGGRALPFSLSRKELLTVPPVNQTTFPLFPLFHLRPGSDISSEEKDEEEERGKGARLDL